MDTLKLNNRMDELDRKMDMILEIVSHQKMKTEELNDLADDLAIVGKDIYDSAVEELDNQKIEFVITSYSIHYTKLYEYQLVF